MSQKGSKKKGGGDPDVVYIKIAQKLIASDWDYVFKKLDATSKKKLYSILDEKKATLKKRQRASAPKQIKEEKDDSRVGRKIHYNFGSRKLHVLKPSTGYPDKKMAARAVQGKLKLFYAHGYSGNFDESRQNIYLSHDGKLLLYYIAAVVVVFNYKANTQKFFTKHNDDVTTLCLSPKRYSYCASGQKDPKDEPGKGKDLPKIYVWNYKTLKTIQLLDDVCWGKIGRVQWSTPSNLLYCICGDDGQTLKAWDPKNFGGKNASEALIDINTMREKILGFEINPKPSGESIDEFLVFGKNKFKYCYITKGRNQKLESKGLQGLQIKIKNVSIASLKNDGEKSFACGQFLPNGNYVVGSASGAVYVGNHNQVLAVLKSAHDKAVGGMCLVAADTLLTAGNDRKFKAWKIGKCQNRKSGLKKTWECTVEVKSSDMVFKPRCIAYNRNKGIAFVGTKTNQIVEFEMKTETASVIVDGHDGQIWALCVSPKNRLFATGGYDRAIKIWNANTFKCIATYEFDKGEFKFCCGHWSSNGDILAFGTEDSNIAVFAWRKKKLKFVKVINIPAKSKNAEIENVSYLRFNDDSSLLGAAHMDSNLYLFTVTEHYSNCPQLSQWPSALLHSAAPTHIQFTTNSKIVKTLTRDYEIAHWTLNRKSEKGKFLAIQPDPDKTKWADDPLVAGWDTQGLYQKEWDGTDLNDATLTSDKKLIASGDDYGTVRLHNYPAINPSACIEYGGHAEFVVGVEFLSDDSQLITCGGNDMAIFQWKLLK